jgi:hypothetical protein
VASTEPRLIAGAFVFSSRDDAKPALVRRPIHAEIPPVEREDGVNPLAVRKIDQRGIG